MSSNDEENNEKIEEHYDQLTSEDEKEINGLEPTKQNPSTLKTPKRPTLISNDNLSPSEEKNKLSHNKGKKMADYKDIPTMGQYALIKVHKDPYITPDAKDMTLAPSKMIPPWSPTKNGLPFKIIKVQGVSITLLDTTTNQIYKEHLSNVRVVPKHMFPNPQYVNIAKNIDPIKIKATREERPPPLLKQIKRKAQEKLLHNVYLNVGGSDSDDSDDFNQLDDRYKYDIKEDKGRQEMTYYIPPMSSSFKPPQAIFTEQMHGEEQDQSLTPLGQRKDADSLLQDSSPENKEVTKTIEKIKTYVAQKGQESELTCLEKTLKLAYEDLEETAKNEYSDICRPETIITEMKKCQDTPVAQNESLESMFRTGSASYQQQMEKIEAAWTKSPKLFGDPLSPDQEMEDYREPLGNLALKEHIKESLKLLHKRLDRYFNAVELKSAKYKPEEKKKLIEDAITECHCLNRLHEETNAALQEYQRRNGKTAAPKLPPEPLVRKAKIAQRCKNSKIDVSKR